MSLEKKILVAVFSGLCTMTPETLVEQMSIISPEKVAIIQRYENKEGNKIKHCVVEYPAINVLRYPDKFLIIYDKPIYYPPEIKDGVLPKKEETIPKIEKEVYLR